MPANLTPDFLQARARFQAAETNEEKLAALADMYATIPKHKGTEKLQADIKRRMSRLRDKEKQAAKKGKRHDEFHVVKQGAGQVTLVGPPNSGKSSLIARFTAAQPEIADYPYTTRTPMPGMMEYQDIQVQLVDTPPISADFMERGVVSLVRNSDSAAIVVSADDDALLDQIEEVTGQMAKSRTVLAGEFAPERELTPVIQLVPAFVVVNKVDEPGVEENIAILREFYGNEFAIWEVSARTGRGIEDLRRAMFESIGIIRVYTKAPGKPPDLQKPFTLRKGSTLLDFAAAVHKDFVHGLKSAKAWGRDLLDGAQIGRDHILQDGYVVELHA